MSLLDSDDDDPYVDEGSPVLRSHTGEPLFGDSSHKGKAKKPDRRSRGEDKRGSVKPVHWSKQKENIVQEKTPKKGKAGLNSAKSSVCTPPDSPKSSRPSELKGAKGGVAVGVATLGLQPSPNIKGQRKRYSQLEAGSSSSDEELADSLFSNKPALRDEGSMQTRVTGNPLNIPSNPFLEDWPPGGALAPPMQPTGAAMFSDVQQQQAWLPANSNVPMFQPAQLSSPVRQPGPAHSMLPGAANPLLMMGEAEILVGSPPGEGGGSMQDTTNPFLSTNQSSVMGHTFTTTPALPTHYGPAPSSPTGPAAVPADSWSISEDLHSKCVHQFNSLQPVKGLLLGDKAREFFVQSKLPNQELSAIWCV